jgi:hypothetical protein
MAMRAILLIVPALALGGCVSTAVAVVKAPFKVVGQAADWATTSQDEADRNRGRAERKAEEKAAKDRRREEKKARRRAEREGD